MKHLNFGHSNTQIIAHFLKFSQCSIIKFCPNAEMFSWFHTHVFQLESLQVETGHVFIFDQSHRVCFVIVMM